jgi:hypothetical protein
MMFQINFQISVVVPHHFANLDASNKNPDPNPHPDQHQIKIRIRICIRVKVVSWIRNRIRISLQVTSQNV